LFESLGCVSCHQGPGFSDASLLGGRAPLRMFPARPIPEESRYGLLGEHGTRGPWRVPSLRNVALSGPYFHNGAVSRLADAVRIMATAQLGATVAGANDPPPPTQWLADERRFRRDDRRIVGERDIDDLVAFLESLTSERLAAMRRQTL
jgi:cytochrome c peroxidase